MEVQQNVFGEVNGKQVTAYTVTTDKGMEITCIDYGCTITTLNVPDKDGNIENIVLGFDTIEEYQKYSPYFGSAVGRIAGRIKDATFELEGKTYELAKNDGENSLHGGPGGFHQVIWDTKVEKGENEVLFVFTYTSPDGEEGFPGNLTTTITYTISNDNELTIGYHATTDKTTIVNLTNHTYFNLSGNINRTIADHELTLKSNSYLELAQDLLPTGKEVPVEGTPFDFRDGNKIVRGIKADYPQNQLVGGGYDHPFLLSANHDQEITLADKESGRMLSIETDEPCVVVYTSNMLEGDFKIRGKQAERYLGICLETQQPPNRIDAFELKPDEVYNTKTKYVFKTV